MRSHCKNINFSVFSTERSKYAAYLLIEKIMVPRVIYLSHGWEGAGKKENTSTFEFVRLLVTKYRIINSGEFAVGNCMVGVGTVGTLARLYNYLRSGLTVGTLARSYNYLRSGFVVQYVLLLLRTSPGMIVALIKVLLGLFVCLFEL